MTNARSFASRPARSFLHVLAIAACTFWVTDAQAFSQGGSPGGGGATGGGSTGGGASSGGGQSAGPGPGERGGRDPDRGGYVSRNRTKTIDVPVGYVIRDDVCTGGKYAKC